MHVPDSVSVVHPVMHSCGALALILQERCTSASVYRSDYTIEARSFLLGKCTYMICTCPYRNRCAGVVFGVCTVTQLTAMTRFSVYIELPSTTPHMSWNVITVCLIGHSDTESQ